MDLQIDIVTPERQAFSGRATQVVVPGWEGQFGVLPQHENFLALVKAGVASVFTSDGERRYVIGRGFAEVTSTTTSRGGAGGGTSETKVTLLTEACELVSTIDKDKARAELAAAQKAVSDAELGSERWRVAQARIELAQARVDA